MNPINIIFVYKKKKFYYAPYYIRRQFKLTNLNNWVGTCHVACVGRRSIHILKEENIPDPYKSWHCY